MCIGFFRGLYDLGVVRGQRHAGDVFFYRAVK